MGTCWPLTDILVSAIFQPFLEEHHAEKKMRTGEITIKFIVQINSSLLFLSNYVTLDSKGNC